MPESFRVLLDQNIPRSIRDWLGKKRPSWSVEHTSDVGLSGAADAEIFAWSQERKAVIVTFDEDLSDQRLFPLEEDEHPGVVRLRVWPTTVEETREALGRLLEHVDEEDLRASLVVVGKRKIRIRES